MLISKTDFLLYLDAPLHLWAKKHNKIEQIVLSLFELNLMEQGNQIEDLAFSTPYVVCDLVPSNNRIQFD